MDRQPALAFLSVVLAFLALAACATSTTAVPAAAVPVQTPPAAEVPFEPPPALGPVLAPAQVRELVPGGAIDWSGKTVWARGAGVLDPGNPARDLAWQMAERAATVVAQRNLLEIAKGIRVDSDRLVQDLTAADDSVYQRVEAVVKTARLRGPARYDSLAGTVEIEMECDLYGETGIEGAVTPPPVAGPQPQAAAAGALSAPAQEFLRQYSVLALDCRGMDIKPALFPRLYDARGALLLDPQDPAYAGAAGAHTVQYVGELDQVLGRPDFGQPLTVRVREARGQLGTDFVLSRADASVLMDAREGLSFLLTADRVIARLAQQ